METRSLELEAWNLLDDQIVKHYMTFANAGQNVLGVRRRLMDNAEVRESSARKGDIKITSLELHPDGPHLYAFKPLVIHVTAAGVPHRVPHSFGFWHINDLDEMYLALPASEPGQLGHFVVLMQRPRASDTESFAWYCEQCYTMLHEVHYRSGELGGIAGFWKAETEAVRRYNGDEANRRCPECGLLNPRAYCGARVKDTPEEAEARLLW
jgi:hypothetical protein